MEANSGEKEGDFEKIWGWFWTKVGLDLGKHWNMIARDGLYIYIPLAKVIKMQIIYWMKMGASSGQVLGWFWELFAVGKSEDLGVDIGS